ncbi:Endoribonuclease L-PSP superfamily [Synechococcus sp. PCC 7335]|uniref:RidA family protein n=1 Tax=Synechococcus sp. (strain ATCC 29403 / PCC 7335) TaxID=91464 RepID=UPI00017EC0A1|nr:RidA family protein [Synechococcus sp. PCC 7335]EDX83133.1 Endoribonuclease L-PSP superfamily [Synechococcus sp. PCC 7335]
MNKGEIIAGLAQTANYRYAQQVGSQLFVAGQVPHDANANVVGVDSPRVQATQCLNNLGTLIAHYGFYKHDIRQLTIYVVGERENLIGAWQAITDWFNHDVPPATLLGVTLLGYESQLVEIDAIVVSDP